MLEQGNIVQFYESSNQRAKYNIEPTITKNTTGRPNIS